MRSLLQRWFCSHVSAIRRKTPEKLRWWFECIRACKHIVSMGLLIIPLQKYTKEALLPVVVFGWMGVFSSSEKHCFQTSQLFEIFRHKGLHGPNFKWPKNCHNNQMFWEFYIVWHAESSNARTPTHTHRHAYIHTRARTHTHTHKLNIHKDTLRVQPKTMGWTMHGSKPMFTPARPVFFPFACLWRLLCCPRRVLHNHETGLFGVHCGLERAGKSREKQSL